MLETRVALLPLCNDPSLSRKSPVGRSMISAGASGEEGDVKVYESLDTRRLISRYGHLGAWTVAMAAGSRDKFESEGSR